MKPVMFLLALFVALVLIGCQESQLVNPTSPVAEKSAIARPAPINEPVEFSYTVNSPYKSPEELFEVKGKIQFELRESPILSKEMYDLVCFIDGEVYSQKFDEPLGWASIKSFDQIIYIGGEKEAYVVLQKSMEVQGSTLPLVINMELMVYRQSVVVNNVWLTTPEMTTRYAD